MTRRRRLRAELRGSDINGIVAIQGNLSLGGRTVTAPNASFGAGFSGSVTLVQ